MYPLYNRHGDLIAYLHQNAIIHPESFDVLGVMLGNCVFGPQAKVLGKIFHNKLYALTGELLARTEKTPMSIPQKLDVSACISQAWQIMTRINDHICPWIPEKEVWSKSSLNEHLNLN